MGNQPAIAFAPRVSCLGTDSAVEVFAKAKQLEKQGRDIIHLEIGQPDFPTAPNICEAASRAIADGYTGYAPAAGLPELRAAVAEHVAQTRGIPVAPEEVAVMPGAKPVIFFSVLALVDAGDEVIYTDPGFPTYKSVVEFAGGTAVPLPLREELEFRFDANDLAAAVSDRTRLLILNSPQNPTGSVLSRLDLEAIARLAIERDFYILSDEIYSRLLYNGKHQSIASLPGMQERTILLDGFSKTYAMTGWRLGYAVAPKAIAAKLAKLTVNSNSCTCSFVQMAGVEALRGPQESVARMRAAFEERRNAIAAGLNAIEGISCLKPAGAFYVFPNVSQLPVRCQQLADYLLEAADVALLPGTAFGRFGEGYLRLSYANSIEKIQEAIVRIRRAIAKLA